jgi:hypothetical protein
VVPHPERLHRHDGPVAGVIVDGLDAETALAWVDEIASDDVPSVEAGADPERRE